MSLGPAARRGSLAEAVILELSSRLDSGSYSLSTKLPSEQELCREFGVSRTVVREAIASLRLGGRLIARQGVGVFVAQTDPKHVIFGIKMGGDIRCALKILELRVAVEAEAVALAAQRRTPEKLSDIARAFDRFNALDGTEAREVAEADFAFHLALAHATGNAYFPQFLQSLGSDIIFDLGLKHGGLSDQSRRSYAGKIAREHSAILSAISQGHVVRARRALRRHLEESLARYRLLVDAHS